MCDNIEEDITLSEEEDKELNFNYFRVLKEVYLADKQRLRNDRMPIIGFKKWLEEIPDYLHECCYLEAFEMLDCSKKPLTPVV